MSSTLDKIRAKVTRAKQHIQDFQLRRRSFGDTKPYEFLVKDDLQSAQRLYYVSKTQPIPDDLTAIAADVIQNLRSPLDHIAYQLVLDARGGTEPEWTVYYPISGSAAHYPATRGGKIKGVRQEVIDAIDATEPYKGGKGHALWQLNELNKPDKHELLIGAGAMYEAFDISPLANVALQKLGVEWAHDTPPIMIRPADKLLALKVGDVLLATPLDIEVNQEMRFAYDIAFNAPGVIDPEPALKTLQDMANLVDDIVTTLGKLLP
jgi:hypothetical protein